MNLVDYLMSSKERGNADAMRLQSMGKDAARAFVGEGKPLNETISGMAKEAALNHEQIKRVAEYANNETFIQKFAQPYDKNVAFPLADAQVISLGVHQEQLPVKTASVYLSTNRRYIPGSETFSLESYFGGRSLEKTAKAERPSDEQLMKMYRGLKDIKSSTESDQIYLESDFLAKFAQLNRLVLQETRASTPPWAIGAAVTLANPSERLYGIITEELGGAMEPCSLTKVAQAGYDMEPDNAITGLVQDLEAVSEKLVASEETIQKTKMAIEELLTLLRGQPEANPTSDLFSENSSSSAPVNPQEAPSQQGGQPGAPMPEQPQQGQPQPGMQPPPMQ